jgi:hypothetical protein
VGNIAYFPDQRAHVHSANLDASSPQKCWKEKKAVKKGREKSVEFEEWLEYSGEIKSDPIVLSLRSSWIVSMLTRCSHTLVRSTECEIINIIAQTDRLCTPCAIERADFFSRCIRMQCIPIYVNKDRENANSFEFLFDFAIPRFHF